MLQGLGMAALGTSLGGIASAMGQECDKPGAKPTPVEVNQWLTGLYQNAAKLRSRDISGLQWQEAMDRILGSVPMNELKRRLDFASLAKEIPKRMSADRTELFHRVELPGSSDPITADGREPHRVLITKVAYIRKGRSIPPHGHSNMASAFLCLSGQFEIRQYDRLEEQDQHMIVRESVHQKNAGVGTWSSISDYRNNVHWLTAKTDDCFLFTSKLINLEEDRKLKGRINIDVKRAKALGSQTLKAPKITSAEARALY